MHTKMWLLAAATIVQCIVLSLSFCKVPKRVYPGWPQSLNQSDIVKTYLPAHLFLPNIIGLWRVRKYPQMPTLSGPGKAYFKGTFTTILPYTNLLRAAWGLISCGFWGRLPIDLRPRAQDDIEDGCQVLDSAARNIRRNSVAEKTNAVFNNAIFGEYAYIDRNIICNFETTFSDNTV